MTPAMPAPGPAMVMPALPQPLIPALHLRKARGKASLNVTIAGDSISRPRPVIGFDQSRSFWGRLKSALVTANPRRGFRFHNRAIGTARWDHLSDARFPVLGQSRLNIPDWPGFDADRQGWIDALVATAPDILFLGLGMNDRFGFQQAHFDHAMATLAARLPDTDIVLVTNLLPNFEGDHRQIGGAGERDARLFVQHFVRGHAICHGLGLIDAGRQMCRAVAGFDPCTVPLARSLGPGRAELPLDLPETDQDFGLSAQLDHLDFLREVPLLLSLGPRTAAAGSRLAIHAPGGRLALALTTHGDPFDGDIVHDTGHALPAAGGGTLAVFLRDNWLSVSLDGTLVFEGCIQRHGGRFRPRLARADGGPARLRATAYTGRFARTEPVLSNAQMFGGPQAPHGVTGGNGLNHPSDIGTACVFGPLLDACNLHIPGPVPPPEEETT